MKALDESDVGILCYISKLPGFRGILKQRYSDFIVNEVDSEGNVVHLTSLDAPPEIAEEKETEIYDQSKDSCYTSEIESFRSLVGDIDAECLKAFIDQISSGVEDSVSPVVLSPSSDKLHRTAVHNFFKEKFKFLVTDTIDGPDALSKCIRVRLNSGGHNKRAKNSKKRKDRGDKPFDSRGSENWPEHVGKFLRFHLYKENKETQEALSLIGKMLGLQPRSFGFAGTKDKRSVSTQRVTVFKQHAQRLASLNRRLIGIKVGDFCHVKEGLFLGQLLGNRFTVTLSGLEVVRCQHTLLELHYCEESGELLDTVRKTREYYKETDDIEGTLRQLPRYLVAERAILLSLKKCPGDYLQALKAIPRTLRMMYVHSYQSYLWNHAASLRVQKYGFDQAVIGDLVYCKEESIGKVTGLVASECVDDSLNDAYDCDHLDEIPIADLPEEKSNLVKAVSAEDLLTGNYTVSDVILPLPGSRAIYPMNDIAEVYHNLAKKDGISLTESVHNVKEFSITNMTGAFRRVFQKPMDFEWELLTYTDGNIPLAETDLDTVGKSKPVREGNEDENISLIPLEKTESLEINGKHNNGTECDRELKQAQESQLALKLAFTLPSSCYATMAIRELLKTSTSVAFHKTLND